jgi:hypothetical protein
VSTLKFNRGDRVRVAEGYHWAQNATGTIDLHPVPEAIGCSRDVKSLQGMLTFYWVHFDEPQTDGEGESGYMQAEIDERFLEKQPQI